MGRAYSNDLRWRLLKVVESGEESARSAARRFGVSASCAIKWVQAFRRDGVVSARKTGRPKGLKVEAHGDFLIAHMKDRDTTLDQLQTALWEQRGMYASRNLLWHFIHENGLSYKKNRTRQRTGQT